MNSQGTQSRTIATQTISEEIAVASSPPRSPIKSHVNLLDSASAAFEEATRRLKPSATGSYPDLRKYPRLLANIPNLGKSSSSQ
jgi:hypothetical protein